MTTAHRSGRLWWVGSCAGLLLGGLLLPWLALGQQVHTNSFENLKPVWVKAASDAPYDVKEHAISDRAAHSGRRAEYLLLDVKPGGHIHYQYATGKAPIGEELSAGLWLKANRPGPQLLARVVLPNERDPGNLNNHLTTTLPGDAYQRVGQWQRLAIGRPVQLAKQQQLLLQAKLNRQLDFTGAYIDTLVLNLYAGPGPTEVWIDDLEIGPLLPEAAFLPAVRPGPAGAPDPAKPTNLTRPTAKSQLIDFSGNHLVVGQNRMLFRAIRYTDTLLRPLRDAGFNTVFFNPTVGEPLLREAAQDGLWVVPEVPVVRDDGQPLSPDEISATLNRYAGNESVLFVRFGGIFAFEQARLVSRATEALQKADPGRLVAVDAWDGLMPYSRRVNLLGVHRWPLMTSMELPQYRRWLELRRQLANPNTFTWTWIQTHLPDWYAQLLYGRPAAGSFDEPVGPQPEHIRLLTYTALAAGCRGLAYYSDRFLADSHQGRDRLLCCALLNQEMDMLEPLLLSVDDDPEWIETSHPEVKAAVMRCAQGVLVLPIWQGRFAQLVPGQAATTKLSMIVPQVPQSTRAWELSPGEVRGLRAKRDIGGMEVTLPEFGLTSAILFTSDNNLVGRFQEQARVRRQLAAQWTYDMAAYELEKVARVEQELEQAGASQPDSQRLLEDARRRLRLAKEQWDSRLFAESYHEAQRALRPLRILMRAQWEKAVRGLSAPTTSPYAVTYYTLPRHHQFMDQVRRSTPGANVLVSGDFEVVPDRPQETWRVEEPTLDDVDLVAQRVGVIATPKGWEKDEKLKKSPFYFSAAPKEGKHCAMLQVRPKPGKATPQALDRTLVALTSPPVRLPPGSLVQVSAWINVPTAITASPDGALFYDSAGGEPLAIRLPQATGWQKHTLYRRVPASGTLQVTLALTGVGTVLFDDVRIEPLTPGTAPTPGPTALQSTSGWR